MIVKFKNIGEDRFNLSLSMQGCDDLQVPGNGDADMILKTVGRIVFQFYLLYGFPDPLFILKEGLVPSIGYIEYIYHDIMHR